MKIAVAYIRGPRGFKGELAAALFSTSSDNLKIGQPVTINKGEKSYDTEVEFIKHLRKGIGLKLAGINDEQTAESWRGGEILVEMSELEPLGEGEFYNFQLEGLTIYEEDGTRLGEIKAIDDSAGNPLLTIATENGEVLIPFVSAIVKSVDLEKKKMVIKKLEGLY